MALSSGQVRILSDYRDLLMGEGTVYDLQSEVNPFIRGVRAPQTGPRPYAHGSYTGAEWQNEPVVPIRVIANGANKDVPSTRAAIQAMSAGFAAKGNRPETIGLYFRLDGDPDEYVLFGTTRGFEPDLATMGEGWVYASASFVAQDPRIYSAVASSVSTGLAVQTGGLTVPARPATTRLRLPGTSGSYASTPHVTDFGVTGALDLRWEGYLSDWSPDGNVTVASKWQSSNKAWLMQVRSADVAFVWSTDGSDQTTVQSSLPAPFTDGSWGGLRVTFDPDDGVGRSAEFWTGPGIAGPWTQLGTTQTGAATTLHDATTTDVEVMGHSGGTADLARANVRHFEFRSGIDGALVADPDFTAQTTGVTSFTDSTGSVWSLHGDAALVADTYRGGLTVPMAVTGRLVGGRGQLTNVGTAAAPLTARIDGPVVEPGFVLYSPDGRIQSVRFSLELLAGQWLEIDSVTHTAFLNGLETANRRPDATWLLDDYPIQPGTTKVRFVSGAYSESANLTVTARSAYW